MAGFNLDNIFYCCKCGQRQGFSVPRKRGRERESGHLKRMYCFFCKEEINHAECKPYTKYDYEEFLLEFYGGNFDENQNRIMPFGLFKDKLVKNGEYANIMHTIDDVLNGDD